MAASTAGNGARNSRSSAGAIRAGRDHYAGRVALITGAGAGIGQALAVRLAAYGARLVLWDRDGEGLARTADRCGRAAALRTDVVDVTDRAEVLARAAEVGEQSGPVQLLFCVAGVVHTGRVLSTEFEDIDHVLAVNLGGVVNTVKAFLPQLISSGGGHVVTLSSAFGLIGAPRCGAYSASKFAVRGFTEALHQEMVLDGLPVRVSCVLPGGVRTEIVARGRFAADEDPAEGAEFFRRRLARTSPERAATVILRGVQRGRAQILVGADAYWVSALARLAGAGYQRVLPVLARRSGPGSG